MSAAPMDPIRTVAQCCGLQVVGIERIHYVSTDNLDRRVGPLVLRFGSGELIRLDVAPDAESLIVHTTPWEDPFGDTVEGENAEFVDAHGKWTRFDVNTDLPYDRILGKALNRVTPITNRFGSVSGVRLEFEGGEVLHFLAAADEAWVMPGSFDVSSWDMSVEPV